MESQTSEKGQLPSYQDIPTDAKENIHSKTPAALEEGRQSSTPPSAPGTKMANYRRTILFLSFTWLVLYGVALAGKNRLRWQKGCHKAQVSDQQSEAGTETSTESSSFAALLNGASPKSLHDLLHRHLPRQFQDGVWESEHHAVRAVHEADPALASSIVQLAKRQDNNSTTASTSESSSSAAPSTSATEPSTRPTPTPTPSLTPSTSTSASIITTSSTTSTTSTTSVRTSATPTETTLTTSTVLDPQETSTTSTTPRSSRPIVTTFTSTSNGNVVTITSTTFIDAEETGLPATTTRAIPGLQNFAPQQQRGSLLAGVIAVVAMLMA